MTPESPWSLWVEQALASLEARHLNRNLLPVQPEEGMRVTVGDRQVCLFSSNDYLGLSSHPRVRRACAEAAERSGVGSRGSALICGYTSEHEELERALARLEDVDAAILTPTGFAANLAVLGALSDEQTAIFSDALNHASIVDGCRMGRANGATLQIYPHGDMNALEGLLRDCTRPRRLVVTDGVFSMDGDLAPLQELATLRTRYGFLLVVDEAHGTLVLGERGGGACEALAVGDHVDVRVGTLSKAVGAMGGFVATSHDIRRWLVNRGRPLVFSTALPIPVVAAAREALAVAEEHPELRGRWRSHMDRLERVLPPSPTPIAPLLLGDERRAVEVSRALLEQGMHVTAIRPPTVPDGTSRLRVTVSAAHELEDVQRLVQALEGLSGVSSAT